MQAVKNWENATKDYSDAKKYLQKIGKKPTNCTTNKIGSLHSVKIETMVHYQEYNGDKNYHDSPAFDGALAQVIREDFENLAAKAMEILINKCKEKKQAAQDEYQEMFNAVLNMEKNNNV